MASPGENDTIVQYIVLRTDLKWNTGALIAQACHASVAALVNSYELPATKNYLADLKNMHKVILKADKLDDLIGLETELKQADIAHHLWLEQPENVATCLAVSPQPKHLIQGFFRHLKLLR